MIILSPSRLHRRGVSRSSRTLEAGCGGRGDVSARVSAPTKASVRTAKACGPGPPMLGLSLRVMTFRRRRQSKPGLRGEHVISVNTIAQGMSVVSAALSLLACAKCTFFARKARGCGLHPAFPAPSFFRGRRMMHHSGISCRENMEACLGQKSIVIASQRVRANARPDDRLREAIHPSAR